MWSGTGERSRLALRWVKSRRGPALPVFVFSGALALYLSTLAPGVLGGDAGELQFVPHILSLAHSTGYPLQTLLDRLWITLLPAGSIAWRTNALSAVVASAGAALLCATLLEATGSRLAALAAALALAVSPVYWGQAVLGDKYALNGLIMAGILWAGYRFWRAPGSKTMALLAAVMGLALAQHRSFVAALLPAAGLLIAGRRGVRLRSAWPAAAAVFAAPLLLYAYVPLASQSQQPPGHALIRNLGDFGRFLLDAGFLGQVGLLPRAANLLDYAGTFAANFPLPLLVAALFGLALAWRSAPRRRPVLLVVAAQFLIQAYLTQNYDVPRRFVFFIPAYVAAACLIGEGVAALQRDLAGPGSGPHRPWRPVIAQCALAAVLLGPAVYRLPAQWQIQWAEQRAEAAMDPWRQDLKTGSQADRMARALALVEPDALILSDWEQATPLWYGQQVEGFCPDCRIVKDMSGLDNANAAAGRPLYIARTADGVNRWSRPYAAGPLVRLAAEPQTEEPPGTAPVAVTFDEAVVLEGYQWPLGAPAYARGRVLPLTLVWRNLSPAPPAYHISLRLSGPAGDAWQVDNVAPVLGMRPFSQVAPGEVVTDYYEVPIPLDAPSGAYELRVLLYEALPGGTFRNAAAADPTGKALGESASVLRFDLPK